MSLIKPRSLRGDTLIEVSIAIGVFSFVTALTITTMNHDMELMQSTLELTMTRNEIDAQAEALRFIQNAYLSERELMRDGGSSDSLDYEGIWDRITSYTGGYVTNPRAISALTADRCSTYYDTSATTGTNHSIFQDKAFIINTRNLSINPSELDKTIVPSKLSGSYNTSTFVETTLYPRIVYKRPVAGSTSTSDTNLSEGTLIYDSVARAEGIWVIATRDVSSASSAAAINDDYLNNSIPEFYDFYIRGCWYAPGNNHPSTISTIIRLYNPEYMRDGES